MDQVGISSGFFLYYLTSDDCFKILRHSQRLFRPKSFPRGLFFLGESWDFFKFFGVSQLLMVLFEGWKDSQVVQASFSSAKSAFSWEQVGISLNSFDYFNLYIVLRCGKVFRNTLWRLPNIFLCVPRCGVRSTTNVLLKIKNKWNSRASTLKLLIVLTSLSWPTS